MNDKKLIVETIRLLLYVAWCDDDIAPEEYDFLLRKARNAGLSEANVRSLDLAMRDRTELVEPDFEYLKPYCEEVLKEVQKLVHADSRVMPQEVDLLRKIASLLAR